MFTKQLSNSGHTRRFVVRDAGAAGWEVREERDSQIVRRVCYEDWHRVERAVSLFERQALLLEEQGWVEN